MSRHTFGQSPSDWTFTVGTDDEAVLAGGVSLTFWDTPTSGTQYTDLLSATGSAIAAVVTSDGTSGLPIGTIPLFYGPDSIAEMWADAGGGYRSLVTAHSAYAPTDDPRFGEVAGLTVTGSAAAGRILRATGGSALAFTADGITDWLNATSPAYGATGDGTTDDLAALQAAIDAAAAAGGGTVYLPRGTYRISNTLVLKTGVTLQGAGSAGWPFRFPTPICSIKPTSGFSGECAISMLGADITSSGSNEGRCRITDLELDGSALPAGSVSGIHAQGEVMDVILARMVIKSFTHNGVHTNVGTGSRPPHDWFMDSVVAYNNASYGFSMSMTDGYIRNCIASSNGLDGWFMGPFGSMSIEGCQALFNTNNGMVINGGTQIGNLSISSFVTDRNGHDGVHLGPSTGSGSGPILFSGLTCNRDGKNGNLGGGGYAGLSIAGMANPVIVEGLIVNTGVDDDGSGSNSPQYGVALSGNAYVAVGSGYVHGDTTGWFDDGTNTIVRRGINLGEATGPKATPTFVYGNGVSTVDGNLEAAGRTLGVPRPRDHGAIAWTYDPAACRSDKQLVAGTVYLAALYVPRSVAATKLFWGINTAGASPVAGESFVGLYNAAGTRLANVGVDSRVATTGLFTETISANLTPGLYWVAVVINATTMPKLYCGSDLNGTLLNFNLSAASARFATAGTGQTALPSSITPASNVLAQACLFAAVA